MQFLKPTFLALLFSLSVAAVPAAQPEEYACPTDDYACHDVINSSLCLSQNAASGTKEAMAACVDYPGGMSDLPGAAKAVTPHL
ncbi:uncharacterized protein EI97DRAFT_460745 [Westerdykella ornata]|uniref:Extracellular membrane protein CFEM domain-containing protein n=1 Tax=Westerdykella ornata TaxID=318751 RepID=A0A6A6JBK2_WESOR|nr:uncharacterized protein EI97DRAFT_460745 [Westerdykella ornata]KAF2273812.1 hypothetical protein EI97DRAFT_460745 [Westerdykella ornata]